MADKLTVESFLKEPTDFAELIEKMMFADETVGRAAAEHPMLYIKAARYKVQSARQLRREKAALDELESMTAQSIRDRGGKVTESSVAEQLSVNEDVQAARTQVRVAEANAELGALVLEAMRHRRDALRIVAELMMAEGNSPYGEEMRMQAQEKTAKDRREALRQKKLLSRQEGEDAD